MFDRIGVRTDGEALRREAQSVALTSLLITIVTGFWVGYTTWQVAAPVPAPAEPPFLAMRVDVVDDRRDDPLPAAPAAPPRRAPEASPPAPDPSAEPQPLSPLVPPKLVSSSGTPDGDPDGDPASTGLPGGKGPPGDGTGSGAGRHTEVHVAELKWRTPVAPVWPEAATMLGVVDGTCLVDVWYDRRGVPESVTFHACPEVFQRSARSAILRSRVEPFRTEGSVTAIQTTLKIRYVPKE